MAADIGGVPDDHEIMNQAFMNEEQHHQPSQESDTTTGGSQPNTFNGGNTMAATAPATVVSSSTKYKKMPEACSDPIFIEFVNDHAWRFIKYFSKENDCPVTGIIWTTLGKEYFTNKYFVPKKIMSDEDCENWWLTHSPYMADRFRQKRSNILAAMYRKFRSKLLYPTRD